jgi:uncharacterized protein (DUF2384 family)
MLALSPKVDIFISILGGAKMGALQQPVVGFPPEIPANLSDRAVQERLSPGAIKAFFRIAHAWKLRDEDSKLLLGGASNGIFYQLKGGTAKRLDQDELTRISLLIGIFKALNILYSESLADAWMTLPNNNPMFQGHTPLSFIIKGGLPGFQLVRRLLDARRGGK